MSDTKNELQAFIAVKVARVLKHIGTTNLAIEEMQAAERSTGGPITAGYSPHLLETSAILEEMLADMTEELKGLRRTQAAYEELRLRSLEGGTI